MNIEALSGTGHARNVDLLTGDYGTGDPMLRQDAGTRILSIVASTVSRVRSLHSHYGDMLVRATSEKAADSSLRWVRPASENPTTRGRKPNVLADGTRVTADSLGINQESWERMRAEGIARPAYYSDDLPAGSSYGGEDRYTETGLAFVGSMLALATTLSGITMIAYRTGNRRAMRQAKMRSIGILSRLATDPRTAAAYKEMGLANPMAHTSETAAERAKRERRGHHQDTSIRKTWRDGTADPTARYAGRGGEAYYANTHTISEDAILSALEADGHDDSDSYRGD